MSDDFEATTWTTGSVAIGGSATGDIEKARDVDWFAVELVAGRTYVIDLEGADTGGGTLGDAMLRGLYDSWGERIAGTRNRDGGDGDNARLTFTATESDTYYIAARSQDGGTGTYTVRVTEPDPNPDGTAAGATDLGDLADLTGTRTYRDAVDGRGDGSDYYRFTLSEAKAVRLTLREQDANADLFLEDADGTVLHVSTKAGTRTERIDETLLAGTYHVRIAAREEGGNAYALRYSVAKADADAVTRLQAQEKPRSAQWSVSEPAGVDFSDDTSTAGRVAVGGSARGRLDSGYDEDWFAVTLEAGKTYRFDLKGAGGHDRLSQPGLYGIFDADGRLVADADADDHGRLSYDRMYFAPDEDGTYYVPASTWLAALSGTYRLSVTELPPEDFSADTDTTGTVAVGGSATGKLEAGRDVDWFAVDLLEGKTYQIDLKGKPSGDGSLRDPYLRGIHDADGNLIAGTANNHGGKGYNSRVLFTADADATYHVAAGADGNHTGTYTVSVTELPDDFRADAATTGRVAVGGSAKGEINYVSDRDWFAVDLEDGKTYRIEMKGGTVLDGTLFDPYLRGIHDANGNLIAGTADDDSGEVRNSRVLFTADADATYYVAAAGGDLDAGLTYSITGTYTLTVDEVVDGV